MPSSISRVYWDACVLLAYINGEQQRLPEIRSFLDAAKLGAIEITTSVYTVTEVAFASGEKNVRALDPDVLTQIDSLWRPPAPVKLAEFHLGIAEQSRSLLREAVERGWRLKPLVAAVTG